MLKVLIIDDEPFVREGLMDLIDWKGLGFVICGSGYNGLDGLDKIMKYQPDIVLVDIRMPGLSGIEVIRLAKEQGVNCQFIILSGYSEFQYAKESISLGVHAYLLKPIDEDELIKTVEQVRHKLHQISQYEQFQLEQDLRKILSGDIHGLNPIYEAHAYQLAVLWRQEQENAFELYLKQLPEQVEIIKEKSEFVIIFKNVNHDSVKRIISNLAYRFNIQVALSENQLSLKEVAEAFKKVKSILEHGFCFEDISVLTKETISSERVEFPEFNQLYVGIQFDNGVEKEQAIQRLKSYYRGRDYAPERIKGDLSNLQLLLLERFKHEYQDLQIPPKEQVLNQVYGQETLQGILEYLLNEWNQISQNIQEIFGLKDQIIQQIEHYVQQYYAKDLTLKVVGDIFNYNPTYLGKKFKLQIGVSFPKYVDQVRIEKSKQLLTEENIKVYEVSEKVGYCNIDYFYRKFKKHVGKSPKEYQKEHSVK